MPDRPYDKIRPAAPPASAKGDARTGRTLAHPAFVELAVTSNYTFLTGASHPEELVYQAAALGHRAASIADTNTMAGIVRAHVAAKEVEIPIVIGCRLRLIEPADCEVIVYPTSRAAYARLSGLLTTGKRRAPKGECYLSMKDLLNAQEEMLALAMPPRAGSAAALECFDPSSAFAQVLKDLRDGFNDDRLSLALCHTYTQQDRDHLGRLWELSKPLNIPGVATGDVLYHIPERRPLQDVLTCVRLGRTIHEAGLMLEANAERHLKAPEEMARLHAPYPGTIARSMEITNRALGFNLDQIKYQYPSEPCPEGMTPFEYLTELTHAGKRVRFPEEVPIKITDALEHELGLIKELGYEAYFLTCCDIVRFARSQHILCQGRGGAANSAVCFCLGITEVDPSKRELLFERFLSRERREPPDIDIDFEHERREDVIQYIYGKYGRDRAALTAEVISYRGRSAVRDVGKAMGLSEDCVGAMAKNMDMWTERPSAERFKESGLNPDDPTIRNVIALTGQLVGFPRHLSQHVGGFVITRTPLHELVPIENAAMEDRTVIEWDKDDIDAMGMLKVDVLGLGMLTCLRKTYELLGIQKTEDAPEQHGLTQMLGDTPALPMASDQSPISSYAPFADRSLYPVHRQIVGTPEDPSVYEMTHHADTIGVFQIESRAQMSMLPRLKPSTFYDLVIEVAIVRPGPIQGGMVHPYLRRREGKEPVTYPTQAVKDVLHRTLGVPLFQEQAMKLAIVAAGFTPDQADSLRRAMAAWKRKGDKIHRFGQMLIDGMLKNGYPREFAERCFEQIKGFSEYGFPESHAASFALLVYASCWLKRYHPAAFATALINSQPMGFYQPAQIIRDAREHGVQVRPIDVNHSAWDCTLEYDGPTPTPADASDPSRWGIGGPAIRLGMRLTKGLQKADADRIAHAAAAAKAATGPLRSVDALWRRSGASVRGLRCLARADAFASMNLNRQQALWQIRPLRDERLELFEQHTAGATPALDASSDDCVLDDDTLAANILDGSTPDAHALDATGLEQLPRIGPGRQVVQDYLHTGLSLKAHPVSFVRDMLAQRGVITNAELRSPKACPQGRRVRIAGVVLVRQRPGTASGVVFITLEDETSIANLIVWSDIYERWRRVIRLSTSLIVRGRIERQGEVVHVHADGFESLDSHLPEFESHSRDFH